MGFWGTLWLSKTVAQLEDFKKTLKNPDEIAAVEKTIAVIKEREDAEKDAK